MARTIRHQGEVIMSGSKFSHHLLVAFASLLMSSIAVGAAIAPAAVTASNVEVVTYA